MFSNLSIPLDIPDVRVIDIKMNKKGDYIITAESTLEGTTCQRCGQEISQFLSVVVSIIERIGEEGE